MSWRRGATPSRRRPRAGIDLTARVGVVELANPVMMASGTAGNGRELADLVDLAAVGAVVVKSLSAEPWAGNPPPRVTPTAAGMLNSVGLDNPGLDRWLLDQLPALAATGATVVVSIWGFSVDDYRRVSLRLGRALASAEQPGAASVVAVEVNISCPNVEDRRKMFAHSEAGAAAAVAAAVAGLEEGLNTPTSPGCQTEGAGSPAPASPPEARTDLPARTAKHLPVWAKLSPNVTDLPAIAGAVIDAGASGLTLVNTLIGLALDPATGRPRLGNGAGGLSGPALHPVAVRAVFECRAAWPSIPIIGVGGISNGHDAAEMLAAGADAIQVGTATFVDPQAATKILDELDAWCRQHHVAQLADLVGTAHT